MKTSIANVWRPMSAVQAPSARSHFASLWTGSELIVWGGNGGYSNGRIACHMLADGAAYDPAADRWRPLSNEGAPAGRQSPFAFWTGDRMLVWGGRQSAFGNDDHEDGALYDPRTDRWTPMRAPGAPLGFRRGFGEVGFTGQKLVVWGGSTGVGHLQTGAIYDVASDGWSAIAADGPPGFVLFHSAVWAGARLLLWGQDPSAKPKLKAVAGLAYDPVRDAWARIATHGAPSWRRQQSAVWSGEAMLVWGGRNGTPYKTGARYNPVEDVWSPMATRGAPVGRTLHSAVWSGSQMLVFGGETLSPTKLDDGGAYDPVADRWTAIAPCPGLAGRAAHGAVWTGEEMLVWGGTVGAGGGDAYIPVADGARLTPS